MSQEHSHFHERLEAHDDIAINPSSNPPLADLINPARRNVLKGGLTLAALGFFGGGLAACAGAAALTTAISLARHEIRLKKRVAALDETLKARRRIEKAVQLIAASRSISEAEAYARIREKSMQSKESIAVIADAIIAASDI